MLNGTVRRIAMTGGLLLAVLCSPLAAQAADQPAAQAAGATPQPIVQQAALDLLKKMSDTLKAAPAMTLSVIDFREVPTTQGQMITLVTNADVTVKRPNSFLAEAVVNGVPTTFSYDGKTFSILDKAKNVYVSEPVASETLDAFFKRLDEAHGIQFSIADFLSSDPYAALTAKLENAYDVGDTVIDGITTTHLVFSAPGIEWQVWIDPATALPRLFAAAYTDMPREPRFLVSFRAVDINAKPTAGAFTFTPPKDARAITFLPAHP